MDNFPRRTTHIKTQISKILIQIRTSKPLFFFLKHTTQRKTRALSFHKLQRRLVERHICHVQHSLIYFGHFGIVKTDIKDAKDDRKSPRTKIYRRHILKRVYTQISHVNTKGFMCLLIFVDKIHRWHYLFDVYEIFSLMYYCQVSAKVLSFFYYKIIYFDTKLMR